MELLGRRACAYVLRHGLRGRCDCAFHGTAFHGAAFHGNAYDCGDLRVWFLLLRGVSTGSLLDHIASKSTMPLDRDRAL
jgi:hypothetical protein